jgi:hypothetical protein
MPSEPQVQRMGCMQEHTWPALSGEFVPQLTLFALGEIVDLLWHMSIVL